MAKKTGIIVVTFHPHTSHKMQPLDRTVFGPFKTFYDKAMADWMVTPGNQGKPVTIYEIAELVGKVYPLAFTPSNITKGFKVAGLFPLNKDIFQDHECLPSFVTDRRVPASQTAPSLTQPASQTTTSMTSNTSLESPHMSSDLNQPSTSSQSASPLSSQPSTPSQSATPLSSHLFSKQNREN